MYTRSTAALLFATAISLLPLPAYAGVKPGGSVHSVIMPVHSMPRHPAPLGVLSERSHFRAGTYRKFAHGFGRFSRHRHRGDRQFSEWDLPITAGEVPFYGPYYDPAGAPDEADPAVLPGFGPFRQRALYRTGCRSEQVSVSSSHGPTNVTVTRCSVPILDTPALK